MMRWHNSRGQKGSVSLFLVILTALLVTTITVAFVRIMVKNQEQATASDLSRSALDSAYAGVEDAKRAMVTYRERCQGSAVATGECVRLARALTNGAQCNTIQESGIAGVSGAQEVLIKRSETNTDDEQLQQAYTCVKVVLDTPDFIGTLAPGAARLIPLKSASPIDTVTVEWFAQNDLQSVVGGGSMSEAGIELSDDVALPKLADWPRNRPALLRTQLIQFGDSFQLSDFDSSEDADHTNNASLFLYPSTAGAGGETNIPLSFNFDARKTPNPSVLQEVRCDRHFSATSTNGMYACKVSIRLPYPIGADTVENRTAFLKLGALYGATTSFRVTLASGDAPVVFSGVQPEVDSTGRANDLFRRIKSRIELDSSSIPYIDTALDLGNDLCKTFRVTDRAEDFDPGVCSVE